MWGQRGAVGRRSPVRDSQALTASWGRSMERLGEKSHALGSLFPKIKSVRMFAAAMDEVMPHLLKPVATYRPSVPAE